MSQEDLLEQRKNYRQMSFRTPPVDLPHQFVPIRKIFCLCRSRNR